MTASISPNPARASSRIMSSARSRACWRHVPRRSRCRPSRRRPTPMRVPGQPAPRPLAGPILPLVASSRRHRSIARRPRLAPRRGRCAGGANAGQGRTAGAARRPRRRFCLAAPRNRPRAGQGRNAGRLGCAGWNGLVTCPARRRSRKKLFAQLRSARHRCGTSSVWCHAPAPAAPPRRTATTAPRPPGNVGRSASVPGIFHAINRHSGERKHRPGTRR